MLQPIPPKCSHAYAALKLSGSPTAWLWHFTKNTCLSEPSAPLCSPCSTSEASRARQLKCLKWRWCYHSPNQPCTLQKASITKFTNSSELQLEGLCQPSPQNSRLPCTLMCANVSLATHSLQYFGASQAALPTPKAASVTNDAHTLQIIISHRNLPCSNITCHSWCMQSHPIQQISGSHIILSDSQHTNLPPSSTNPILIKPPVLATHFTL